MGVKVLVTGASGFIGRHLVERLLKNNFSVIALIKSNTDVLKNFSGDLKIVEIDITQPFELNDIGSNIEKVIHLAGIVGEGACSKDVRYSYELNVTGVSNLINCFHGTMLNKFIYLSSVSVYDKSNESPISEYDKTSNIGIYNSTKLAAELLVSAYCTKYDISYCIGRATSTYGPYQLKYSVLSYIILELLKHNKLTLFNPYDIKDYIYVTDLADGIITLMNTKESGLFNISSGQGIQLSDLVGIIAELLSIVVILKAKNEAEARKSKTRQVIANSKLRNLGWVPITDIYKGMEETINYLKNVKGDIT